MLPELTEFVPATRMGIVRKVLLGQTTEQVTIIQLVTILPIYRVQKI
jgi:hypothetical protein